MSTEFAVGDRIETLANIYSFGAGYLGTVVKVDTFIGVFAHLDEWHDSSTGPWIFNASEVKLIPKPSTVPITRTGFKIGDRVEVVDYQEAESEERKKYVGRQGSVLVNDEKSSFITVEIDDERIETFWYPEELRSAYAPKPPITRDELNHERAQYQATIDNLNDLLDEIYNALPRNRSIVDWGSMCLVAVEDIRKTLNKRPEMP